MNKKVTQQLCLLFVSLFVSLGMPSLAASAQTTNTAVTIHMTNAPMRDVMAEIEKQTKLLFGFNENVVDVARRVSVNVDAKSFQTAVNQMIAGSDITYNVSGMNIILSKRQQAPVAQPTHTAISGVVRNADGKPVLGASVMIAGTTTGTSTDANGAFVLNVPVPAAGKRLEVSFMGYDNVSTAIGNRTFINITLQESVAQLDRVVVTGMAVLDKRTFTGASDRIDAAEMIQVGVPEVSRSLEGRSAGVTVQNVSGTFGAAPKIRIRGATSIYGDSKPLWVVDGVVMEDVTNVSADALSSGNVETLISSAISGLNADDIESFQILKDGSATSIYGARAMAGVIVVTTKRGKAGMSRVSYSGEFTMRQRPSYNQFNIMNSQEQMGVYQELYDKGFLRFADIYNGSNYGVYGKMYELTNTYDPATGQFLLSSRPEDHNKYLQQAEYRNTDWFKELFRLNPTQTHSVSLSAGNEKSTFYGSVSMMEDPGWTERSKVRRMTANTNFNHKILPNLNLTLISTGSYRQQEAPGSSGQSTNNSTGTVSRSFEINPYSYALQTSRTLDPNTLYRRSYAPFNIHNELANNYVDLRVLDLKFQGEMKWNIMQGLDFSVLGALKYSNSGNKHYVKDDANQAMAYRAMDDGRMIAGNGYLYTDPDHPFDTPISILPEGGFLNRRTWEMLSYDFRAAVNWNKSFGGGDHYTSFYGGMETNSADRYNDSFTAWGVQYLLGDISFWPYQYFKDLKEANGSYYSLGKSQTRNAAFFGLLTYTYLGRYTLNGTIRYEGSNQLGKSRRARWLPTWNIAGRWNVSNERFFENITNVVSSLGVRASYSLTADKVPSFIRNSEVLIGSNTPYRPEISTQETALIINYLENSEQTYEKKHELNLGLDASFFNDRITMTADAYWRKQFDLMGLVNTMGLGGFATKYANVAGTKSSGVELSISSVNINKDDFSWETSFIFSKSKNEITSLLSTHSVTQMTTLNGYSKVGRPVRSLYSFKFLGLNSEGIPIIMDPITGQPTSNYVYFGTTQWNEEYLQYEGPSDPTIAGSIGNTLRYKNWHLNLYVTYSAGNKIRLSPTYATTYSDLTASPRDLSDRWMVPGDEKRTNIPAILTARQVNKNGSNLATIYGAYNLSNIRMVDGGFVRMKEISLSYDLPRKWLQGWKSTGAQIKFQVTNPFLIYSDKRLQGQDPEFVQSGGVSAPMPTQWTLSLKLSM